MRINVLGVVLGAGAAFLVAALVAVVAWSIQLAGGSDGEPTGAVIIGAVAGAVAAGYVAGRFSIAKLFNGAVTGVVFTGVVTVVSVLDGSPASTGTIALFVVAGLLLGSAGGYLAHRRATRQP